MTRSLPHFAMPHLSDEAVAAVADGVLTGGAKARAEHHLSECAYCAGAVTDQRQTRLTLRSAATPSMSCSLLERLRDLPRSAPLGEQPGFGAMSADGIPVFAAFDARRGDRRPADRPVPDTSAAETAATPEPASSPLTPSEPVLPRSGSILSPAGVLVGIVPTGHRRVLPGVGISAAAAAAVIVGVLATTATTAGGTTAQVPVRSGTPTTTTPAVLVNSSVGATVLIYEVMGR